MLIFFLIFDNSNDFDCFILILLLSLICSILAYVQLIFHFNWVVILNFFCIFGSCNHIAYRLFLSCGFLPSCITMVDLLLFFQHFAFGILSLEAKFVYLGICQIVIKQKIYALFLDLLINLVVRPVFSACQLYLSSYNFIYFSSYQVLLYHLLFLIY